MKYRAEIDGLRALAVLPVILFHAGFEWFSGGFVGVDVFFVISGYLITTIIISEMAEDKFSIVDFYERRARRILPALFFVILACLPFAWVWLTPNDLKDFGQSLVAVSTFSSNILFWIESGYFDTAAELKPLLHTWSLSVEEQYYILFPVFLMLTWRLGLKWILIILLIIFSVSLGASQWGAYSEPSAAFYLLPARGWELLLGVFAAIYLKYNFHIKINSVNQVLSLLGIGMIVYSVVVFDSKTPFPSLYALIPTVGTGLLILCAVPKTFVYSLLSLKPIVGIGLISYSAYLWHQPLLAFARHRLFGVVPELTLLLLCFISLIVAWFSWKFVEKPFRDKKRINQKSIFLLSGLTLSIFISLGLFTHFKGGFSGRFPPEIRTYLTMLSKGVKARNYKCHLAGAKYKLTDCYFGNQSTIPDVALIGDSHAGSIHSALASEFDRSNKSFFLYAKDGCPPSLSIEGTSGMHKNCPLFNLNVIQDLKDKGINTAILFSRFSWYLELDGFQNSYGVRENKKATHFVVGSSNSMDEQVDEKIESMRAFISELRQQDIRVLLIHPIPEMGWDIPKQKIYSSMYNRAMLAIDRKGFKESTEKRFDSFVQPFADDKGIFIINTTDIFCDEEQCFGEREGDLLYYDDDHPTRAASMKIVAKIMTLL